MQSDLLPIRSNVLNLEWEVEDQFWCTAILATMALPDLWLKLYWMIHFAFLAFAEGLAVPRY